MKKILLVLLMIPTLMSVTSMAQTAPSLSSFTNTLQQSQLRAFATWAGKVEGKRAADSVGAVYEKRIAILENKVKAIDSAYRLRKSNLDSLANFSKHYKDLTDTVAALRNRFNGLNTAIWRATEANIKLINGMRDTVLQLMATVTDAAGLAEVQRQLNLVKQLTDELILQVVDLKQWAERIKQKEYIINFK